MKKEEIEEKKEGGNMFGLIKKVIFLFIIALGLMYFFKKELFDTVLSFITNLF